MSKKLKEVQLGMLGKHPSYGGKRVPIIVHKGNAQGMVHATTGINSIADTHDVWIQQVLDGSKYKYQVGEIVSYETTQTNGIYVHEGTITSVDVVGEEIVLTIDGQVTRREEDITSRKTHKRRKL